MRLLPRTSPETDRCMDLIQQLASVVVRDLCVDVGFESVVQGNSSSFESYFGVPHPSSSEIRSIGKDGVDCLCF